VRGALSNERPYRDLILDTNNSVFQNVTHFASTYECLPCIIRNRLEAFIDPPSRFLSQLIKLRDVEARSSPAVTRFPG
jgi:hypothetical protein